MKKKIYTIGRDPQSDIWLQDNTDVASRNHAVLEVMGGGKYLLTDQSRNGTYVNGIKISTGAKVPVTRRDVISFAHVQELDWNLIPSDNTSMKIIISVLSVVAVAVVALVVFKVTGQKSKEQTATENIATLNLYTDDSNIIGGGGSVNVPMEEEQSTEENEFERVIGADAEPDSTETQEVEQDDAKPQQPQPAKEIEKPIDAIY